MSKAEISRKEKQLKKKLNELLWRRTGFSNKNEVTMIQVRRSDIRMQEITVRGNENGGSGLVVLGLDGFNVGWS
jgi:hypothetical protein